MGFGVFVIGGTSKKQRPYSYSKFCSRRFSPQYCNAKITALQLYWDGAGAAAASAIARAAGRTDGTIDKHRPQDHRTTGGKKKFIGQSTDAGERQEAESTP